MNNTIEPEILIKAESWLKGNFDEATKSRVKELIDNNPAELTDAFYRSLEFGTGGLRGIMGVGTNRMNKYTVAMATQGLANYLLQVYPDEKQLKVAISYDCRNNSKYFAGIVSDVFAANGFKVFLFDDMRPTPELSFAVRHLHCQSGVMITASHNPKEYNGYKAYWNDGAQMIAPHDVNVIAEVEKITDIEEVKFNGDPANIISIGKEIDAVYLSRVKEESLAPELIHKHADMKIVYTPLHGTGMKLVPDALKDFGFTHIIKVEEQFVADGNFPTIYSPNPEEPSALKLAIEKAKQTGAELVMATDPDADRVGIAIRDQHGEFILLNGNQTAALLFYYVLHQWKENGKLTGKEYIVSTIVTSEILRDIAEKYHVEYFEVLTGFKFIADLILRLEDSKKYILGGEESFGYLIGDFVRDKDAVSACAMIAETAAWAKEQGTDLFGMLLNIYQQFGFYKEGMLPVTKKGKEGAEAIEQMMAGYRSDPMKTINGQRVTRIKDFKLQIDKDMLSGKTTPIDLPVSNVLQFFLEDGSRISVRPSGTEPKIKFYIGVKEPLNDPAMYETVNKTLDEKIESIISSMGLR